MAMAKKDNRVAPAETAVPVAPLKGKLSLIQEFRREFSHGKEKSMGTTHSCKDMTTTTTTMTTNPHAKINHSSSSTTTKATTPTSQNQHHHHHHHTPHPHNQIKEQPKLKLHHGDKTNNSNGGSNPK